MATNFLWSTGNVSSTVTGLITTAAVSLMSTAELNALTSGAVHASSATGNSGVFTSTYFSQGIWADIFYLQGSSASTVAWTAGSNIAGWFLTSPDQTSFESSTGLVPPRVPDFTIQLPAVTAASNSVFASRMVMLPALPFKTLIQVNCTGTLASGSTGMAIKAAPIAMQY